MRLDNLLQEDMRFWNVTHVAIMVHLCFITRSKLVLTLKDNKIITGYPILKSGGVFNTPLLGIDEKSFSFTPTHIFKMSEIKKIRLDKSPVSIAKSFLAHIRSDNYEPDNDYRRFEPILRELGVTITPDLQKILDYLKKNS